MKTYKQFLGYFLPSLADVILSSSSEDIILVRELLGYICAQMTDYELGHNEDSVAGALASTAGELIRMSIDIEINSEVNNQRN
jgi:hypothetical protein